MKKNLKEAAISLLIASGIIGAVEFGQVATIFLAKHMGDKSIGAVYMILMIAGVIYFLRRL